MSGIEWKLIITVLGWMAMPSTVTLQFKTELECERAKAAVITEGPRVTKPTVECVPVKVGTRP